MSLLLICETIRIPSSILKCGGQFVAICYCRCSVAKLFLTLCGFITILIGKKKQSPIFCWDMPGIMRTLN